MNFDTPDCHVVGGCELYTIKAAGADKKLYKDIDTKLESQYESLLRLSASLSPPAAHSAAESLNLARSSPFGRLSEHSARRTYAYLIAILNASHPDYDFSHLLRPSDFKRAKSLKRVMNSIDTLLFSLRPNMARDVSVTTPAQADRVVQRPMLPTKQQPNRLGSLTPSTKSRMKSYSPQSKAPNVARPAATQHSSIDSSSETRAWGPRMWKLIDDQMSLRECALYSYSPEEDPYAGEDDEDAGAIWSYKYFFFNKARKRVCYLYIRGISVLNGSYPDAHLAATTSFADDSIAGLPIADGETGRRRARDTGWSTSDDEFGREGDTSRKRAKYWLGNYGAIRVRRNFETDDDSDHAMDEDDERMDDTEAQRETMELDEGMTAAASFRTVDSPDSQTAPVLAPVSISGQSSRRDTARPIVDEAGNYAFSEDEDEDGDAGEEMRDHTNIHGGKRHSLHKDNGAHGGVSEEMANAMEI